ncbi:MAG: hypothetical protein QOJ29_3229 [Thermoleophilaceae bacterium]|nr:hypothetical protein [Thermoleophilaceae bacterium]
MVSAAVAVAGCGGAKHQRRDAVERFIQQVNDLQTGAGPSFTAANKAYVAFSKGKLPVGVAKRDLAKAERSMRDARDQVAALEAPADARVLQRRMVAFFDADAALAHEATLLSGFVPAATDASKPLVPLGKRLSGALTTAKSPAAQEDALRRYASGLAAVIGRLEVLHPPPLLLDRHHAQVSNLREVRALALRLVTALNAQDSTRVANLLLRFRRLSAKRTSAVDPSALRAYNRRFRGVQHAQVAVERERARLEKVLP